MWFKQAQIFQLSSSLPKHAEALESQLETLAFTPCLPSLPSSVGWVSPIEQNGAPLVEALSHYWMICLQFEEKILPATVVQQQLKEKIAQQVTMNDPQKINREEKQRLKEEITHTLLSKAFTKLTRVYAYIDTKHHWLIINTTNAKKTTSFIAILKRCIQTSIDPIAIKKPAPIMTRWLVGQAQCPFEIEKACVLQDPQQQQRLIRCQHQDLFNKNIQGLIKEGFEVKQMALSWKDRVRFVLSDDISLRSIHFEVEMIASAKEASETDEHRFQADFFILSETLSELFTRLLKPFIKKESTTRHTKKQSMASIATG